VRYELRGLPHESGHYELDLMAATATRVVGTGAEARVYRAPFDARELRRAFAAAPSWKPWTVNGPTYRLTVSYGDGRHDEYWGDALSLAPTVRAALGEAVRDLDREARAAGYLPPAPRKIAEPFVLSKLVFTDRTGPRSDELVITFAPEQASVRTWLGETLVRWEPLVLDYETRRELLDIVRSTASTPPSSNARWTLEAYAPFDRLLATFEGGESNLAARVLRGILADAVQAKPTEVRDRAATRAAAGSTSERVGIRRELDDLLRARERGRR
jgi:hypothetical protein